MSSAHAHRPGEVIAGKYRLVSLLGEGGMGSVWLARNVMLDIDVAVKLIRGDFAEPEAAWRLLQEARAAARIGHASIVRVFDFGTTQQNEPFLVMEVLQGESLGELLDRPERFEPSRAVRILLPVASALAAAHEKGIIHRDLKPDNIILVPNEAGLVPKIVDFGVAKLHPEDGASLRFTKRGDIVGTPGYMSPEQASGAMDVDHRADVWAFCVVLYEVLTGQFAFDGSSYHALLAAILMVDPIPIEAYGIGDRVLWAILAKGFSKNPRDRWQSMRELGTALAAWLVRQGIETDVAGNSVAVHWRQSDERQSLSAVLPVPAPTQTTSAAQVVKPAARSPSTMLVASAALSLLALAAGSGAASWMLGRSVLTRPAPLVAPSPPASASVNAAAASLRRTQCPDDMTLVAGGRFWMGSDDPTYKRWQPAHPVTIDTFCIDLYEVTAGAYKDCSDQGECKRPESVPDYPKAANLSDAEHERHRAVFGEFCNFGKPERTRHPINCVSWSLADGYCKFRKKRLPTEAEWELAAGASDGRKFPWGDQPADILHKRNRDRGAHETIVFLERRREPIEDLLTGTRRLDTDRHNNIGPGAKIRSIGQFAPIEKHAFPIAEADQADSSGG